MKKKRNSWEFERKALWWFGFISEISKNFIWWVYDYYLNLYLPSARYRTNWSRLWHYLKKFQNTGVFPNFLVAQNQTNTEYKESWFFNLDIDNKHTKS